MVFSNTPLGWSITAPFKKVGHVVKKGAQATGHGVSTGVKATGHGVKAGGKFVAHHAVDIALITVLPIAALSKLVLAPALKLALRPIRSRVNTLKDRRAKKLAWDRRKSKVPTAAEIAEAKSWAKHELLHSKPPFGPILSLLAGPPAPGYFGGAGDPTVVLLGEPATATIIASIPVLLAIMNALLSSKSKSGEAPASVGGEAGPGDPIDQRAIQQAAGQAAAASSAATTAAMQAIQSGDGADDGSGGDGGGGGGAMVRMPGGLNVKRSHLIVGGVVVGGLVLLMLLKPKS